MVAPKGKELGGIRILDESKASKKEQEFKGQRIERRRSASVASMANPMRLSNGDAVGGRVSLPRKPVLVNASTKPSAQANLENGKGMMNNGRKSLADIGNLNNRRSQQYTNQLSNKPKNISRKDKFEEAKKPIWERSNASRGYGRFIVGTQKVTEKAATTRKLIVSASKLRRTAMGRKVSNTDKFETAGKSGNKIRRGCDRPVKNDLLVNIDDISNPLEVAVYVDDIYQYYWTMEIQRPSLANYMEIQQDINFKMRSILVNWLIEVHHKYQLMEESLFLMIELLDRLLSIVSIKKDELQLFGLTTLLLASKYEDYWHPKVDELISLSGNQYTKDEMLGMEIFILNKLKFCLSVPTPYVFMLRFLRAAQFDKKLEDFAFYLIELCLVENEYLKYKLSMLCASAIFVARSNLKLSPPWTRLLAKHSRYEESQLRSCAEMILRFQKAASCKPVKYTYLKYLKPDRSCVASIKSINMLPP